MTGSATATAAIMTSSLVLMAGSIRAVLSAARQGTASPRSLVVSGAMLALGICGFASSVLLLGANG